MAATLLVAVALCVFSAGTLAAAEPSPAQKSEVSQAEPAQKGNQQGADKAHTGHEGGDAGTLANVAPELTPEQKVNPLLQNPGGAAAAVAKQKLLQSLSSEERAHYARVDEKGGHLIPPGIILQNEMGQPVDVLSLMDKPTVIAPVYYSCPGTCHLLLSSLARILPQVNLDPIKDYQVIAVSFDDTDTPALATQRKQNFLAAMDFAYPPTGWVFLSGNKENIDKLMSAIGFRYKRLGDDFVHPTALIVTAPGGKVSRYLYGQAFMPFDLTLSLTEAAEGKVLLSLKRVISYCFTYDPGSKRYVFNILKVGALVILFGIGVFIFILVFGGKSRKAAKTSGE